MKWLLPVIFFAACNNNNGKTGEQEPAKTGIDHAGHSMTTNNNNYCDSVNNGLIAEDTMKGSPARTELATINGIDLRISYNSPGVKGRTIWGGLVAYDKIWATGAHKATNIEFSKDVEINGKKIPAGKYAFFTIPGKEKWTVILNTRIDQHLADDYNEKEDVIRLEIKPEEHVMTPRLTYTSNEINDRSGEIVMQWEKLIIRTPFKTL